MTELTVYPKDGRVVIWVGKSREFEDFHDHLFEGGYFRDHSIRFSGTSEDFVPIHSDDPITLSNLPDVEDVRPFLGKFILNLKDRGVSEFHSMMMLYDCDVSNDLPIDKMCEYIGVFDYE
ncbi:hypothetical protein [Halocynthiibacter sp.]|uniref:hypothetical protein n=1 Tax=Halocynthiibacter sp. TaxID=1979210 RepID=UPI003C4003BB